MTGGGAGADAGISEKRSIGEEKALSSFKTFQQTIAAKALDASHAEATFENGSTAILDLSGIEGQGPWAKLQDSAFFEHAHAAFGTIVWPDGIDLAPEEVWVCAQKAAC